MIVKHFRIYVLAALCCVLGAGSLHAATAQDQKAATAATSVANATTAITTMTNAIVNANTYVYSDAIALLAPMADTIADPIWASIKLVADDAKQAYLNALLTLAAALVDNRERATPTDLANLRDAFDANISSDDYSIALTSPFKSPTQIASLTAAAKLFAKPIIKKQDTKSIVALILTNVASSQSVDPTVFGSLADIVVRRLDDDESVSVLAPDGTVANTLVEFQVDPGSNTNTLLSSNYFDSSNYETVSGYSVPLFKRTLSYPNSWPNIRAAIEKVCGNQVYRAFTGTIDVTAQINQTVNGTSALRSTLLSMLVAPITMDELARCIDRLSSIDPFTGADVARFMNRVKMLRTYLSKSLVKSTSTASKLIAQRVQFVIQSKINNTNAVAAGTTVAACTSEINALLDAMGSETYNDQIPDVGTVIAIQWKNPTTGLNQYLAATPVVSNGSTTWTFSADCTTYTDDRALFWSLSNADKMGLQCLRQATPATNSALAVAAPGLVVADNIGRQGADGVVKFATLSNDLSNPANSVATSVTAFKNNGLTQFMLEGAANAVSFKSASFVAGVAQQSGYLSVGPDGVVRTFNAASKSPAGVFVNNTLTPGPWETFTIIKVEQFFVDLAKMRNYSDESSRMTAWQDSIKQAAADTSPTAADKRLAVTNELLLYIESKVQRIASLPANLATQFANLVAFADAMFAGAVLAEPNLNLALSKLQAEIEIPVSMVGTGPNATVAPMPLGLPIDGQTVVVYIPALTGSSSGRYLEVIQESLDPSNPSYVVSATAVDPVAPAAQFKVSVFRNCVAFESVAFPGNVIQVGVAGTNYANLAQEARGISLRTKAFPLAKDNRGAATGFWEDVNMPARFELRDDSKGNEYLMCVANNAYMHVDSDGFLRSYDATKFASKSPVALTSMANGTPFQILPVKDLYAQLAKLQTLTDDVARITGYQNLITHIETNDDVGVFIDELGVFFDSKRINQKTWTSFAQNVPVQNGITTLLKMLKATFAKALTDKTLSNRLNAVSAKFLVAPSFSSQTVLTDGQIVALGWKNDAGVTQYISTRQTPFGAMQFKGGQPIADVAFAVNMTMTQLEAGKRSPIDGLTHFKVLMRPNSGVVTLQSLQTGMNMQAVANATLADIEDRYNSPDYAQNKAAFDAYKADILGVAMGGELFTDALADERALEEFQVVATNGLVSFVSVVTGGFLSVSSINNRLVTIDPTTVKKAGMNKGGVMVPTAHESFMVVPVSTYITSLGDILTEPDLTSRLARYLYYVTGGTSAADRKIFLDSMAQEVAAITATRDSWATYMSPSNADARAAMAAIIDQLRQDSSYQQELKTEIEALAAQLDSGYTGTDGGGIPPKGSTIVLQTLAQDKQYVKIIPSEFNPSIYVLAAGVDGSADMFDPACMLVTDARTGMLGLKFPQANNQYAQCPSIDVNAAKSWIMAKRNTSTELTLTGTSFGTLGYFDDQLFDVITVDPVASTVQLQNIATGGYLSWVVGKAPLPTDKVVSPADGSTNAVAFSSSTRLRVIDPATLMPFGPATNNAVKTSSNLQGTTFKMIVFDEYYKAVAAALGAPNYTAKLDGFLQALPLIKSEDELSILIAQLKKIADMARADKASQDWASFSSQDVQAKFTTLLKLISQNFSDMLSVGGTGTQNANGTILSSLMNYEGNEEVPTYTDRWNMLQGYLDNMLTPTCVADFMQQLNEFVADRTDAITLTTTTIVPAGLSTTATTTTVLNYDLMITVTTWLAQHVLYNNVLKATNQRPVVAALVTKANSPVTYDEYINYIDTRWVSGKDRFTANERQYVLKLLLNAASLPWLTQASADDSNLSIAKDLLFRAAANQFRDDDASVAKLNAAASQLMYPMIPGAAYMTLITQLIQQVHTIDPTSKDFASACDALVKKASLWNSRVILSGAGQLDLYNFATTLNLLLIDPLVSSKFTKTITPILQGVASALNSQGISFSVAGAPATSSAATTLSTPAVTTNSSGLISVSAPSSATASTSSSGLSI